MHQRTASSLQKQRSGAASEARSSEARRRSLATKIRAAQTLISDAIAKRGATYEYQDKQGKLSIWTKLMYGAPMFTIPATTMLISIHGTIFFTSVGAPLAFISFFTAAARSLDVMTDPAMGYISDTCKRPEGRRRPFMFMGSWGYAVLIILLFSPPATLGATATALWFGFFYLIFYLFDTLANVPYTALGPELTNSSEERNSVFFYSGMFKGVGILVAAALPVALEMKFKTDPDSAAIINVRCDCDTRFPVAPEVLATSSLPATDFNSSACASAKVVARAHSAVQRWCTDDYTPCTDLCDLDAKRMSFFGTASFFGLFYLAAMLLLVRFIKERPRPSTDNNDPPLIPSLMATLRNRPFLHLLPAWVLDYTAFAMIGTMLPFYVQYVVAPDTASPWCDNGKRCPGLGSCPNDDSECCAPAEESEVWCETSLWLGVGLCALMGATIISMPCWLWLTSKIGKFRAWLVYNMFTAVTNGLFVFVGKGDPKLCVLLAFFNGLPNGAQFITESILADVIDYDEFLTGQRSEGRFTIFTTFIPKIVSIPAQALPLAALAGFGFVQPVDGVPQPQPEAVVRFIKLIFFVLPFFLALASFAVKATFPLNSAEQSAGVQEGIALHAVGKPAIDPVTKFLIPVFKISTTKPPKSAGILTTNGGAQHHMSDAGSAEASDAPECFRQAAAPGRRGRDSVGVVGGELCNGLSEEEEIFRLGYFFPEELQNLADIRDLPGLGREGLVKKMRRQRRVFVAVLALCCFLTLYGLDVWIHSRSLSFLPALSVIGIGLSGCGLFVANERFKMAKQLKECPATPWLLDRYITYLCGINYVRNREECRRLEAVLKRISADKRCQLSEGDLKAMVIDMMPPTDSVQEDAHAHQQGGVSGGGGVGAEGGEAKGNERDQTPRHESAIVDFELPDTMEHMTEREQFDELDFDSAVDQLDISGKTTPAQRSSLRGASARAQSAQEQQPAQGDGELAHHFASPSTTIHSTKVLL